MHYLLKPALIAGMALSVSAPASAEVKAFAQANLSNIALTVQDLTPTDGRAAGFVLGERMTNYFVINEGGFDNMIVVEPLTPTPVDFSLEYAPGTAAIQSDGKLGSYTSSVTANTRTTQDTVYYDLRSSGWDSQTIVLKAGSALTVTGLASGLVDRYVTAYMESESIYSNVTARLSYVLGGTPLQSFQQYLSLRSDKNHDSFSSEFSLYAENSSDQDMEINLELAAYSSYYGYDRVGPVPEPSTWLMMAVGAIALSGRAWRKSRRT